MSFSGSVDDEMTVDDPQSFVLSISGHSPVPSSRVPTPVHFTQTSTHSAVNGKDEVKQEYPAAACTTAAAAAPTNRLTNPRSYASVVAQPTNQRDKSDVSTDSKNSTVSTIPTTSSSSSSSSPSRISSSASFSSSSYSLIAGNREGTYSRFPPAPPTQTYGHSNTCITFISIQPRTQALNQSNNVNYLVKTLHHAAAHSEWTPAHKIVLPKGIVRVNVNTQPTTKQSRVFIYFENQEAAAQAFTYLDTIDLKPQYAFHSFISGQVHNIPFQLTTDAC